MGNVEWCELSIEQLVWWEQNGIVEIDDANLLLDELTSAMVMAEEVDLNDD